MQSNSDGTTVPSDRVMPKAAFLSVAESRRLQGTPLIAMLCN